MNSLNILSARVIGQTPRSPRSRSVGDNQRSKDEASRPKRSASQHTVVQANSEKSEFRVQLKKEDDEEQEDIKDETFDEKTPLLERPSQAVSQNESPVQNKSRSRLLVKKLADALVESIRWVLSKMIAPGVYILSHFYDDEGHFSAFAPIQRARWRIRSKNISSSKMYAVNSQSSSESSDSDVYLSDERTTSSSIGGRSVTPVTSDSEMDSSNENGTITEGTRNKPQSPQNSEKGPTRRSIRIKLHKENSGRQKKEKKSHGASSSIVQSTMSPQEGVAAAELKSPTSPASSLGITKYPHAPTPPRPLIPRRQPSYSSSDPKRPTSITQKTLVIDLDETLIHSLAKGGRMSSGHMVEVKLSHPAAYNGLSLGSQHPILYYVHKRPYCDEFLRKVCKWYNLVAFTASVQEYADPVIDWLEQERKYFSARYYRQHCTFRNGAYIKDLSSVEPDLSKVMILDNSPLSYIFHEGT